MRGLYIILLSRIHRNTLRVSCLCFEMRPYPYVVLTLNDFIITATHPELCAYLLHKNN